MSSRIARLAATLLISIPLAAPALQAQGLEYATGTRKYRVSMISNGTQTSPMGSASFELGIQQRITVNLAKTAKDTVTATMTLDSIALKSSGPAPDVSQLPGAKFVAYVAPTGRFYSGKSPDGLDPQVSQMLEGVLRFLPTFRADIAAGMTWSDTTTGKANQQGMEVDRTSISNFKVAGDTTIGADKAFRIQRVTSVKAAGSGSMQGTPVAMESVVTSTGVFFLTPTGVYLGGNSADDVNVKISILSQNVEVIIKQTAKTNTLAIP